MPIYARLAVRDLAIAAAALGLWRLASGASAGDGALADLAGVGVGLLVGGLTFLLHEWGHLLGALASRSALEPARGLRTLFLFSFDSRRNSRGQFLAMSFAGFAGTALAVLAWYAWLPSDLLASRVARGVGMLSVTLTLLLEVPLVGWALLARGLPPVETFGPRRRA